MTKKIKRNREMFPAPLKDKTARELSHEVLTTPVDIKDSFLLGASLDLAYYAHEGQFRHTPIVTSSGKTRIEDTEYIYHPLRNTVRLMRWGVTDLTVLIGSVLHDTVEDAPEKVVMWNLSSAEKRKVEKVTDEAQLQSMALKRLDNLYTRHGLDVKSIVSAVTNPIREPGQTKADRNAAYVKHVSEAVRDPQVFLVKFSDICDNALSLHFTPESRTRRYLANRYLPLAPILDTAFSGLHQRLEESGLVSSAGLRDIERRVIGMESYLSSMA